MTKFPDSFFKPGDFDADLGRANAGSADKVKFTFDPLQDALAMGQFVTGKTEAETALANNPELADPVADYDSAMVDSIQQIHGAHHRSGTAESLFPVCHPAGRGRKSADRSHRERAQKDGTAAAGPANC